MTKAILLTTIVPVLLILMLSLGLMGQKGCIDNSLVSSIEETRPLRLSDYPAVFKENTVIVIGQEPSEIEEGAADLIKGNLRESFGPQPAIKHDREIIGNDKGSNLILIGLPSSNDLLQEFYATTGIDEVTSEYPGKNKGILQILKSPWSLGKASMIVAGSDKRGMMAALEMLDELKGLDESIVILEFQSPAQSVFSDDYVFLEHYRDTHIKVIAGQYRGPIIDSPTYSFDEENGTVRNYLPFDVNDSLMLVYGKGSTVSGAGGGRENMLHGAYRLPHQFSDLTVLEIDSNGTVYFEYGDSLIILIKGGRWEDTVSRVDVTDSGSAELTITDWVKNHGFLQKARLEVR